MDNILNKINSAKQESDMAFMLLNLKGRTTWQTNHKWKNSVKIKL
jgi:hypothetical protein